MLLNIIIIHKTIIGCSWNTVASLLYVNIVPNIEYKLNINLYIQEW